MSSSNAAGNDPFKSKWLHSDAIRQYPLVCGIPRREPAASSSSNSAGNDPVKSKRLDSDSIHHYPLVRGISRREAAANSRSEQGQSGNDPFKSNPLNSNATCHYPLVCGLPHGEAAASSRNEQARSGNDYFKSKPLTSNAIRDCPLVCGLHHREAAASSRTRNKEAQSGLLGKRDFPPAPVGQDSSFERKFVSSGGGLKHVSESRSGNWKQVSDFAKTVPGSSKSSISLEATAIAGEDRKSRERAEVQKLIKSFREILAKKLAECKRNPEITKRHFHVEAARVLKEHGKWLNSERRLGQIPGVKIGDRFQFRAELNIIGLHRQFFNGIDFMNRNGTMLATSIVDSSHYDNEMKSANELVYVGEGGGTCFPSRSRKSVVMDQQMKKGNLALKNSINCKTPVRVIRHSKLEQAYAYDGLFLVKKCWEEKDNMGKLVFKFLLKRLDEQPELTTVLLARASMPYKGGHITSDISQGKEDVPISVTNTLDDERPPPFIYITSVIYPKMGGENLGSCCDCLDECSLNEDCSCKVRNGGVLLYDRKERLITKQLFVNECGPLCCCSDSCLNRVTQRGTQVHLEVFRTRLQRWGVRAKSYISKGSFVCEYIGKIIESADFEDGCENEYLFALKSKVDKLLFCNQDEVSCAPKHLSSNIRYIVDASRSGNVARFINHSDRPNLDVQHVFYDTNKFSHVAFFAAKDIPPATELTYDFRQRFSGFD